MREKKKKRPDEKKDEKKGVQKSWMVFKQTLLAGEQTIWEVQDSEQLAKLAKQNCTKFWKAI